MNRFAWYKNRLKAMSLNEIIMRFVLTKKKIGWKRRDFWIAPKPSFSNKDSWVLAHIPKEVFCDREAILVEANCYLQGYYKMLNISFCEQEIDWLRDPETSICSPLSFGLDLNYRDFSIVGNVKNIWEKNRHHHLTILALAYALTQKEEYAENIKDQLSSWIKQNPFPLGVNWTSSLELGIRLISWVWVERLIRGSVSHNYLFGQAGIMWGTIYWHQWLIMQHYSHGSSANNHLIGEMAGVFIASSVWPFFEETTRWRSKAKTILEREIVKQTFPSGLNREQAFSYHIFSLEFLMLAGLEGDRIGNSFSFTYKDYVKRMIEIIPSLVDMGGNLPRYGDSDDGMALQLRPYESSRLDWLLILGKYWLGARAINMNKGLLTARVIYPEILKKLIENEHMDLSKVPRVDAIDAGVYVMSYQHGTDNEIFCMADAGPLGYLSIAAHGHADALSFTLSVGGKPIIIDSGTYTYHAYPEWRDYFRSTKAHNTIVVDNADQSLSGGSFLWVKKAKTKVLQWEKKSNGGLLIAEHYGYTRLPGRVVHKRKLLLENKNIYIFDQIEGKGEHDLEWRLHFSPFCKVEINANYCYINWNKGQLKIKLDQQMQWKTVWGELDAGWYSKGFNHKEPTYTLIGYLRSTIPVSISSFLEVFYE